MATYTSGIPLATDKPRNTQPVLKENIDAIPELLVVDHIGFNVPNKGKHAKATFPAALPAGAPLANELRIFSNAGVSSGRTELFFQRDALAAVNNMTERQVGIFADATGWTYIASGIKMVWGQFNLAGAPPVSQTIMFSSVGGFPGFTAPVIPGIQLTARSTLGNNRNVYVIGSPNNTQFTMGSDTTGIVYWRAMGV